MLLTALLPYLGFLATIYTCHILEDEQLCLEVDFLTSYHFVGAHIVSSFEWHTAPLEIETTQFDWRSGLLYLSFAPASPPEEPASCLQEHATRISNVTLGPSPLFSDLSLSRLGADYIETFGLKYFLSDLIGLGAQDLALHNGVSDLLNYGDLPVCTPSMPENLLKIRRTFEFMVISVCLFVQTIFVSGASGRLFGCL